MEDAAVADGASWLGEDVGILWGVPRSGTTLLSVMLDRHPDVHCPPEPWLLLALQAIGHAHSAHPANAQLIAEAFDAFSEGHRIPAARAYAREIYTRKRMAAGKQLLLDKTPLNLLIVDFIHEVLPAARPLILLRNPLDVAASHYSTWGRRLGQLLASPQPVANAGYVPVLEAVAALAEANPRAVIRYEQLVASPESELARAQELLGVRVVEGLTSFDASDTDFERSRLGDRKVLETREPHTGSIGTWRSVLPREDIPVLADALGPELLVRLGYANLIDELRRDGFSFNAGRTAAIRERIETALEWRWVELREASVDDQTPLQLNATIRELRLQVATKEQMIRDLARACEERLDLINRLDEQLRQALAPPATAAPHEDDQSAPGARHMPA